MLLKFLEDTSQNKIKYILISTAFVLIAGLLTGEIIALYDPEIFNKQSAPYYGEGVQEFFLVVIFAPIFETFLMIPILFFFTKITKNMIAISLFSALTWAFIHALVTPLHGVFVLFSFFIYSYIFKVWDNISRKHALLIVMAIHALNNLSALFLDILFPEY